MFERFFDFLFPPRADELLVRALSEEALFALVEPRGVDGTEALALLPFREARVRALVHEAKYRGSPKAFALLAAVLADYLGDADCFGAAKVALVPVPLGERRRRLRGYNQAEEIAREALARLDDSARITLDPSLLLRTRETPSQVSLPRAARLKNMRGAFRATRPADGAYLYMVIDDVVTTGATLAAATEALRGAGAKNVIALALAHA